MISTQMQKEVVMFDCLKGEVSVYTSIHGCLIVIVDLQLQKKLNRLNNTLYADVSCWPRAFTNLLVDKSSDPGVHFHAGLSDCKANIGEAAELECKVNKEDCVGIWYKDGEEVSPWSKCDHFVA